MIIHQMIPILMRPSVIWSWITPTQPSSSAITCPVWSDTTLKPHTGIRHLGRSWSKRPTGWADGSTLDDPKSWPRRRVQVSGRRKKSRSFAAAEMNCSSAFGGNSRSFTVQRDKPSTISMRRPNEPWVERSKHESGNSWSRSKKNTTPSLRCKICEECKSATCYAACAMQMYVLRNYEGRRITTTYRHLYGGRGLWVGQNQTRFFFSFFSSLTPPHISYLSSSYDITIPSRGSCRGSRHSKGVEDYKDDIFY